MPDYELILRFTAADEHQADRIAAAIAGMCAVEYGTRDPRIRDSVKSSAPAGADTPDEGLDRPSEPPEGTT